MTHLTVAAAAPEIDIPNSDDRPIALADLAGKYAVLYFYPKDNTPGCTTEALDFSRLLPDFQAANAIVYGVSPDSVASHCKFIAKQGLKVELLSDVDRELAERYGVWQLKKFMGKEYMGVVRSTFLLDPQGKIVAIWSPVKVKGHAEIVLHKLQEIIAS
jgi:thioredoxin-dependent peroxiredoxin